MIGLHRIAPSIPLVFLQAACILRDNYNCDHKFRINGRDIEYENGALEWASAGRTEFWVRNYSIHLKGDPARAAAWFVP